MQESEALLYERTPVDVRLAHWERWINPNSVNDSDNTHGR